MNCSEVRKLITLGAGGDLEPDESKLLEAHLASCGKCRALLEAFRRDHELVASLREKGPEPPGSAQFWAGLRKKLEPEVRRRRARVFVHRVLRGITAAAVLLIVVTFLMSLETQPPPPLPPLPAVESVGTVHEEVELETKDQRLELEECEVSSVKFDF